MKYERGVYKSKPNSSFIIHSSSLTWRIPIFLIPIPSIQAINNAQDTKDYHIFFFDSEKVNDIRRKDNDTENNIRYC
jgi:hypothetical protein